MKRLLLAALLLAAASAPAQTLDLYFIDVEQGSALLAVTPAREALLIDAGNNARDAERVLRAARDAGLKRIDYLVVTHYHGDHYGGVPEVAARFPVRRFIDHGDNVESGRTPEWHRHWEIGFDEKAWSAYLAARSRAAHVVVRPGDRIPLRGVEARVLTSAGRHIAAPLAGAGAANPACAVTPPRSEDETEDGQSIGLLIGYGKFRFVTLGDMTWNGLHRLFCPMDPIGKVDAYVTSHHAMSIDKETGGEVRWGRSACSEAELHALRPRVAILNYGERYHRVGGPRGWQVVRRSPRLEDFWQLHYQTGGGAENNVPEQFIANLSARDCAGNWIKLSAEADGSFTVTNTRNGFARRYAAHRN